MFEGPPRSVYYLLYVRDACRDYYLRNKTANFEIGPFSITRHHDCTIYGNRVAVGSTTFPISLFCPRTTGVLFPASTGHRHRRLLFFCLGRGGSFLPGRCERAFQCFQVAVAKSFQSFWCLPQYFVLLVNAQLRAACCSTLVGGEHKPQSLQ